MSVTADGAATQPSMECLPTVGRDEVPAQACGTGSLAQTATRRLTVRVQELCRVGRCAEGEARRVVAVAWGHWLNSRDGSGVCRFLLGNEAFFFLRFFI